MMLNPKSAQRREGRLSTVDDEDRGVFNVDVMWLTAERIGEEFGTNEFTAREFQDVLGVLLVREEEEVNIYEYGLIPDDEDRRSEIDSLFDKSLIEDLIEEDADRPVDELCIGLRGEEIILSSPFVLLQARILDVYEGKYRLSRMAQAWIFG
jgi:hypothetical protein